MGISLYRGPTEEPGGGFIYQEFWETVKEHSVNGVCLSLWEFCEECSFTGNSASYVRHVKEGYGNAASLSL
jgi:hypothetical protein